MLREYAVIAGMLGVETLVVVHWFLYPHSAALATLALVAGVLMSVMAAADVLLLLGVARKRPQDPQQHLELRDLAHVTPLWWFVTTTQVAFVAAALLAGVLWIAGVVGVGQGAELLAVALARWRTRGPAPMAGAAP